MTIDELYNDVISRSDLKQGEKLICINGDLLEKGETYYFHHYDIWVEENVYVKDCNNIVYWAPKDHFMTIKQERKNKLDKLNETTL